MTPPLSMPDAPFQSEFFGATYIQRSPFPDLPLTIDDQIFETGDDSGLHKHEDFYALYVVGGGRGIHDINGHPYSVKRGDVYIAAPGSVHAYRNYGNVCATVVSFQTGVFSDPQLEALRSLPGFWNLRVSDRDPMESKEAMVHGHRLHVSPEQLKVVDTMVDELRAEIRVRVSNVVLARMLIPQLFVRLLAHLARLHEVQTQTALPTRNDAGLAEVLRICEERFGEPLSVPQLAATMFLSPGRFSEVFSEQMGITPAAYLRGLRLERAQTLLRTTENTAARIATEVGFANAPQFSRVFRSAFGLTPSEYRAIFKK